MSLVCRFITVHFRFITGAKLNKKKIIKIKIKNNKTANGHDTCYKYNGRFFFYTESDFR